VFNWIGMNWMALHHVVIKGNVMVLNGGAEASQVRPVSFRCELIMNKRL